MNNEKQFIPCQGLGQGCGQMTTMSGAPVISFGAVVVGGLFFYALYRICKDAVTSVAMNYNKEVRHLKKDLEKTLKKMEKRES